MLTRLDIHNVVLVEKLSLQGDAGLVALTGETGAGKSILLDALGLALGARAEAGLVRHGADQAVVTASFDLPPSHPARDLLRERGIEADETLILRRNLGADGRSKAFINDTAASVQLLKEVGAHLVEIHGQFDTQGLFDASTHRGTLDDYAGIDVSILADLWHRWRNAAEKLAQAEADAETAKLQEEYLTYAVEELEKLNPQPGEDEELAKKRQRLMNRGKRAETWTAAADIISGDDGLQSQLGRLDALLSRTEEPALSEALSRAKAEVEELGWQIDRLQQGEEDGEDNLEAIEDRYFALRECARKHRCAVDDLPAVHQDLADRLRLITHRDDALAALRRNVDASRGHYITQAEKISATRAKAATKLAAAVNAELPDLKLDKARVSVDAKRMADEKDWGPGGMDRVQFMIATNPQTPPAPLHKIASGGELSRFMLALKAVLAETGTVPTLIFDEVDAGIGGAVADAVGERLARLAAKYQVLVVTHSPQVAARAQHHWHVAKQAKKGSAALVTHIAPLADIAARQEEIARMLSGATVTAEARAQAARLLEKETPKPKSRPRKAS